MSELVAIHRQHIETLDDAVREVNIAWGKSDDAANKCHTLRVEAGRKLIALRKRIEEGEAGEGVSWWKWYHGRFVRGRRDAAKVMKLAGADDPEAAHEAAKKKNAAEQQASRAKSVQPKDNADVSVNLSEYDGAKPLRPRWGPISIVIL
jgi:hypothetical protein